FLLLPLYTNLLSPADYGVLEIILLVGTFLNVFFGLQTVTQLLRFYHACEGERDRREVVSTAIIFTGAVTAAAILPADLLRDRISLALFGTVAIGLAAWVLGQTGLAVSLTRVRTFLAFGVPMIGWSLAVFAVNAADRMVLSRVGSLSDVGVFSLANRFGTALLVFIVTPFSCFWAAERFAIAKQRDGKEVLARVFTYFFVLLCFVGLAVSVWSDDLVRLMAAERFRAAARICPVLVLAYVLWGTFDA